MYKIAFPTSLIALTQCVYIAARGENMHSFVYFCGVLVQFELYLKIKKVVLYTHICTNPGINTILFDWN